MPDFAGMIKLIVSQILRPDKNIGTQNSSELQIADCADQCLPELATILCVGHDHYS